MTPDEEEVARAVYALRSVGDPELSRIIKGLIERQLRLLRRVAALEREQTEMRRRLDGSRKQT